MGGPKITQKHSAIAAIAFGDKARVYAQIGSCEILEYQFDGTKWNEGPVVAKAKEGSPIAAAAKGTDYICVYYVDEENIIREVSGSRTWKEGTLSRQNWKVHPPSKLAAGWYDELVRIYAQAEDGSLLEFVHGRARRKARGIRRQLMQMAADAAQHGPPVIQLVQISQSDRGSRMLDTHIVNPDVKASTNIAVVGPTTQLNNMHPDYLGDSVFMDLDDLHWEEWWFKTDILGNGGEFKRGRGSEQMCCGPIAATQVQDEQINVFGHWWNDPYHINGWSHSGRGADWNAGLVN